MHFQKTNELKTGFRIAKPIYNKEGVLLYNRGTTISQTVLNNLSSMHIYGMYVLDPAEPLPHISEEDLEFEKFQTVATFTLRDCIDSFLKTGEYPEKLKELSRKIVNIYGSGETKITFLQSIRGPEDSAYKHFLNVAMLCAIISNHLNFDAKEQTYLVQAAFVHDLGKLIAPAEIINKPGKLSPDELTQVHNAEIKGFDLVRNNYTISAGVRRYISQLRIELTNKDPEYERQSQTLLPGTKVIKVADIYDVLTAMRVYKEPTSAFSAIKFLLSKDDLYDEKTVNALIAGINILPPGCCVELTNGEQGLVLSESEFYPLRPTVLGFKTNTIYDLSQRKVYEKIQIKDIMKTMDNRFEMKHPDKI